LPRIRSIHPEACESEKLVGLSDGAERTYWRLLTQSDDAGRGKDNPQLLAAKLYPVDDAKTGAVLDEHLAELEEAALLARYVVDGKRYYEIHDFGDWQKPRHPTPSKFPSPEEGDGGQPNHDGPSTADRGSPTAERRKAPALDGEGDGEGGRNTQPTAVGGEDGESGADDPSGQDRTDEAAEQFEQWWSVYPARAGKKVGKAKSLNLWRRLTIDERRRAFVGARNLAASDQLPKDPERFLRRDTAGAFPFDDWQEPALRAVDAQPVTALGGVM
jgi:hypothetical protein